MTRRNVELLLLIVAAPLVIIMFAMMVLSGAGSEEGLHALSFNTLGVPIGIFVAFLLAHFAIRKLAPNADPALLPITFALSGIGIAFVTRLAPAAATRQLVWMFAGVAALVVILLLVRKLDRLSNYKYTLMIVGVLLLLSPMLPVIGNEINGSDGVPCVYTKAISEEDLAKLQGFDSLSPVESASLTDTPVYGQ